MRRIPALATALLVIGSSTLSALPEASAASTFPIDVSACFAEKVAVDRSGDVAYIGCSIGGVTIANLATGGLVAVSGVDSGDMPSDVAAGDSFALAALPASNQIRKIARNGSSTKFRGITAGDIPMTVDLTTDGAAAVIGVDGASGDYLAIAPVATKTSTTVALLGSPVMAATFTRNNTDFAYVLVNDLAAGRYRVETINLSTGAVFGSPLNVSAAMGDPVALETTSDGAVSYLLQSGGWISVLKPGSASVDRSIVLGAGAWSGLSFAPDGSWAYALGVPTVTGVARVSVINVRSDRVTALPDSINDVAFGLTATTRGRIIINGLESLSQIVTDVPVVTALSKDAVSAFGRTSLTLRGLNLGDVDVFVGGATCDQVGASDTTLTCLTPSLNSLDDATVTVRSAMGSATAGTVHVVLPSIDEPVQVDAFTSDKSAVIFFNGSSLPTALMKGYRISLQGSDASGRAANWRDLVTTTGTKTAFTFTRAALGVESGDLIRFRVQTVAVNGQLSPYSTPSPWRQMTDVVAPPMEFSATYAKATDYLTIRWKSPGQTVPGGRNCHGYEFQYKWPGTNSWTQLGEPLRDSAEMAVFSLANVPKGTFTVRIRAIGWPEKFFSPWTAEAAIRK